MANKWMEGFDVLQSAAKYAELYDTCSYTALSRVTGRRTGSYAMRVGGNPTQYLMAKSMGENLSGVAMGIAVKFEGSSMVQTGIMGVLDAGTWQISIAYRSANNTLSVYRGSPSTGTAIGQSDVGLLQLDTWYWIEFYVSAIADTGANVTVKCNGVTVINLTNQDTKAGSNAYWNQCATCSSQSTSLYTHYDDWYVNDLTGSVNNNLLGDRQVNTFLPNADGTYSQWTPNTGTDHYALVDDEAPDDDTTYLASGATAGNRDTWNHANIATTVNIHSVQHNMRTRKLDTGTAEIAHVIKSGTTTSDGTTLAVPATSYDYSYRIAESDPDTATAWTASGFNAAEFGIKQVT